jgi:hypothetical protein
MISPAQEALIFAISGGIRRSIFLNAAWKWYFNFLERKINEAWASLLSSVLQHAIPSSSAPDNKNLTVAIQALTAILLELRRGDLALVEIVDGLYNQGLLKETYVNRSRASQMVFVALGWISMPQCISLDTLCWAN